MTTDPDRQPPRTPPVGSTSHNGAADPWRPLAAGGCSDLATDDGLRAALLNLNRPSDTVSGELWEEIGYQLLCRARRDARRWQHHRPDFLGAYVLAAMETLKLRPEKVSGARSPWGVLVAIGRRAGQLAVGANMVCGLVARDPRSRHARMSLAPKVVSLDQLMDAGNDQRTPRQ